MHLPKCTRFSVLLENHRYPIYVYDSIKPTWKQQHSMQKYKRSFQDPLTNNFVQEKDTLFLVIKLNEGKQV